MPDFVRQALADNSPINTYHSRPPYQQNDYTGWINRAVRNETKRKRPDQVIDGPQKGNVYMEMKYSRAGAGQRG
jgi:uncharacterized protein YdeI (YjbR/CyaY-like superfamily)